MPVPDRTKYRTMKNRIVKILALSLLFSGLFLQALPQENPVSWRFSARPAGKGVFEAVFEADIRPPYHMYDLGPYEAFGPNATLFTFEPSDGLVLEGGVYPFAEPQRVDDPVFGMEIGYYAGKAVFGQKVRLTAASAVLKGNVEWMVCDETTCLPPADEDFEVRIGPAEPEAASSARAPGNTGSLWGTVVEAVLWGLAALLTPCVFPMVPMTVSFFLKGNERKGRGRFRALMYGVFIVALYTLPIAAIILVTRVVGGDAVTADIFNWLATHWLPNVIFFLVFMVFAASFFGAFEITMPSRLVNRSDRGADRGGLGGLFFMALTLVLVSFSCTGPIVGSVLIKSTAGEFWEPIVTMFAFSVAFALPFTLFAFFPSLLKNLPKSGGWLNSVKVVLGFVEVALGLKFLSVADQTYHWGILDREVYLAVWIVVFALLGFYLLGKLRFAHDSEVKHVGVFRLLLAIVTFSFVVYLLPGMFGAPLKGLAGYLPPMHTQDFVLGGTTERSAAPSGAAVGSAGTKGPKYGDFLHLPHGLQGFFDFEEGMAHAREAGKPVLVDFTGHGCVNCREMEARVWSAPEVLSLLRDDYVIIALYSDDKKQLPESDWVTTESGKVLKSLGKINSYFARTRYGVNAQPCYLLLDDRGELLVPPRGYDLSVPGFAAFLESGIAAWEARKNGKL